MCVCFLWSLSRCLGATLLIRQAEEKLSVFLLHRLQPLLRSCKQVPKRQSVKIGDKPTDAAPSLYLFQRGGVGFRPHAASTSAARKPLFLRQFVGVQMNVISLIGLNANENCVCPSYHACWHVACAAGLHHLPECLRQIHTHTNTHAYKGRQRLKKEKGPAASSLMFNSE